LTLTTHSASKVGNTVAHTVTEFAVGGSSADDFAASLITDDRRTSAVCKLMKTTLGQADPGCETSAAYTVWVLQVPEGWALYDAHTGVKQEERMQDVTLTVDTALPRHKAPRKLAGGTEDAFDIARFLTALALHERGHGAMGEMVHATARGMMQALPPRVDPAQAAHYNKAVTTVLHSVLVPLGKAADVEYDAVTGHGLTQAAIGGAQDKSPSASASDVLQKLREGGGQSPE
jgi:predicted secreted Zn-dependent protease